MKKGFTLVELLVVIALIAGISVVAVTSLIGIADKRKDEEWENVKSTIETSAKSYYNANQYLFENMDNVEAYVTVGKLVKEGYLNVVKNPKTGKEVSYCSKVVIIIKNGSTKYTYYDFKDGDIEGSCDYQASLDSIEIRTMNGPQAKVLYLKSDKELSDDVNLGSSNISIIKPNSNGWFNIDSFSGVSNNKLYVCLKPSNKVKVYDKSIKIGNISFQDLITIKNAKEENSQIKIGSDGTNVYCKTYDDGVYKDLNMYLEDEDGGYWSKNVTVMKDTVAPTVTYNGIVDSSGKKLSFDSTYQGFPVYDFNKGIYASVNAKDDTSGINNINMNEDFHSFDTPLKDATALFGKFDEDEYFAVDISAKDYAGNEASNSNTNFIVSAPSDCPTFMADGELGDDDSTYVSDILVSMETEKPDDVYSVNLYGNESLWSTNDFKSGVLHKLTANATHQYKGYVINKYGLKQFCASPTYTKDTIAPNCGTYSYEYYKGTYANSPRTAGSCSQKTDWVDTANLGRSLFVCYGSYGTEGTKIAVTYTPSADTKSWEWYAYLNYGNSGNYYPYSNNFGADTKFFRAYDNESPYDTYVKNNKTYGKYHKRGYAIVYDAAGNSRYCYTQQFRIAKSDPDPTPIPSGEVKKSKGSCYSNLTYEGTKNSDTNWYRSNVKVKHGKTTLCTITSEGIKQKCSYTIAETATTLKKTCNSGVVNIDKTSPSFTYGGSYGSSCRTFEKLSSNIVDHRGYVYLQDGSKESKSSGIADASYNYKYSKHSGKSCSGSWCVSSTDASNDNMLKFARANAALYKRTTQDKYFKIRFDFNFLENDSATLYLHACDRAGNCTSTNYNVANKGSGKTGYCRKLYSVKKGAPDSCSGSETKCYLVPDK